MSKCIYSEGIYHRPLALLIRGAKVAEGKYYFFSAERAEKKRSLSLSDT